MLTALNSNLPIRTPVTAHDAAVQAQPASPALALKQPGLETAAQRHLTGGGEASFKAAGVAAVRTPAVVPAEASAKAVAALVSKDPARFSAAVKALARTPGALDTADAKSGLTLSMRAAAMGRVDALETLRAAGADVIAPHAKTDANVLHFAGQAPSGGDAVVRWVFETYPDDAERLATTLNRTNLHSPFMEHVFNTNAAGMQALLDLRAAGKNVDVTTPTAAGWAPLAFLLRDPHTAAMTLPALPTGPRTAGGGPRALEDSRGPHGASGPVGRIAADVLKSLAPASRTERDLGYFNALNDAWAARKTGADFPNDAELARAVDATGVRTIAPGVSAEADAAAIGQGQALLDAATKRDLGAVDQLLAGQPAEARAAILSGNYGRLGATPLIQGIVPPGGLGAGGEAGLLDFVRGMRARGADPTRSETNLMLVNSGFRAAVFNYPTVMNELLGWVADTAAKQNKPEIFRDFLNYQGMNNGYSMLLDAVLRHNDGIAATLTDLKTHFPHDSADWPAVKMALAQIKATGIDVGLRAHSGENAADMAKRLAAG